MTKETSDFRTMGDLWLQQLVRPADLASDLRDQLVECWIEVTNAGGAAGFPFPPVGPAEVGPAVDRLAADLEPERVRVLVALEAGIVAGWVALTRHPRPPVAHWGEVRHLQTRLRCRGRGVGSALMNELRRIAHDELSLEQLHLAARGGVGLERFYQRLGWREIGRWPGALRLGQGDDRDEVLMVLAPL
jgi:GNAT superfamily N-acetyltransferase